MVPARTDEVRPDTLQPLDKRRTSERRCVPPHGNFAHHCPRCLDTSATTGPIPPGAAMTAPLPSRRRMRSLVIVVTIVAVALALVGGGTTELLEAALDGADRPWRW